MDTNIILILIGILSLLLIVTIFSLVLWTGIFSDVSVRTGKPTIFVSNVYYKAGSYLSEVGPTFTDVTSIAPSLKTFVIYYEDPSKCDTKCRWAIGVIFEEETDDETKKLLIKFGYKPFKFPSVENVVQAEFPSDTPFSVAVGKFKVYPQLEYYVQERNLQAYPWLEVYDGKNVHYILPLSKQEEFFVPEAMASIDAEPDETPSINTSTSTEHTQTSTCTSEQVLAPKNSTQEASHCTFND